MVQLEGADVLVGELGGLPFLPSMQMPAPTPRGCSGPMNSLPPIHHHLRLRLSQNKQSGKRCLGCPRPFHTTSPSGLLEGQAQPAPWAISIPSSSEGLVPYIWNLLWGQGRGMELPGLGLLPLVPAIWILLTSCGRVGRPRFLKFVFLFLLYISQELQITQLGYSQNRIQ